MKYDALTLDTEVFDKNRLQLNGGLLAQLSQFKEGSVQFVISEIVQKEVIAHLDKSVKSAKDNIQDSTKKIKKHNLPTDVEKKLQQILDATPVFDDIVSNQMEQFINNTGAEIVSAELADTKTLVEMYFNMLPPFENNDKKKCEFPDALALLSLEKWAEDNDKKILAISNDNGWKNYAENSKRIDVVDDLSDALELFQEHLVSAKKIVNKLLVRIDSNHKSDSTFIEYITDSLAECVGVATVDITADCKTEFDVEESCAEYEDFSFLQLENEYQFKIIKIGRNRIVAEVSVEIDVKLYASILFSYYDYLSDEDVPIGGLKDEWTVKTNNKMILAIEGDFKNDANISIGDIWLVDDINANIDFLEHCYEE